jgi:filamentous hemagglutinin family protein
MALEVKGTSALWPDVPITAEKYNKSQLSSDGSEQRPDWTRAHVARERMGAFSVARHVGVLTASFALVSLAWAGTVASTSLPTGAQVAQGAVTISQSGAVMSINQSTAKAVLNWNSFDIGAGAKVNITQPSANAVMLNRVIGANPSQILGQLSANGRVVLVNPNGILFGKDGSVNASSFTASTLGITDANFMAGNNQFERNGSSAGVVNQGSIETTGGYVALLGASVSNEGKIYTQGGGPLAAADTVKIPVSGSGRIKLELSPSSINAALANAKGGTIVTEGGQVYMQAAALSSAVASIIQSGSIDTTGEQGGAVHLLADAGQIKVDGVITANSTGKDGPNQQRKGADIVIGRDLETGVLAQATDVSGAKLESSQGFVETSGEFLKIDGIQIKAGEWLLDPNDIVIGTAATSGTGIGNAQTLNGVSQINAVDLGNALTTGTTVTVQTSSTATGGNGDITVNKEVTAIGDGTLRLLAHRNLTINANIDTKGGDALMQTLGGKIALANSVIVRGNNISLDTTNGSISADGIVAGTAVTSNFSVVLGPGSQLLATNNLNMRGNSGGSFHALILNGKLQATPLATLHPHWQQHHNVQCNHHDLGWWCSSKLSGIHTRQLERCLCHAQPVSRLPVAQISL